MSAKLRKMLGDREAPCTQSLLSLIDTRLPADGTQSRCIFTERRRLRMTGLGRKPATRNITRLPGKSARI